MRRGLTMALLLLLPACATTHPSEPTVQVVTKLVPTPTPCVSDATPPAPAYPDTDAALRGANGAAGRYGLLAAGRQLRIQRLSEVEPIIAACRN